MVSGIVEHDNLAHIQSFKPLLFENLIVCRQVGPLPVTQNELKLPVFRFHTDQVVVVAEWLVQGRHSELHVFELRVHVHAHPSDQLTQFDLDLHEFVLRRRSVLHPFDRQYFIHSDLTLLNCLLTEILELLKSIVASLIYRLDNV